jgi:FkbM family methyltransferase
MTFELDLGELIDVGIFLQQYERDVVAVIERLACPGWTVLDIGANIGAHTLRFSRMVGAAGRVFAFEPMEYAFAKLARNVSLNDAGNTQTFRIALSDRNLRGQRVGFRSSWASNGERRPESSVADLQTLDDWCAARAVTTVHLIKLDVDGHELQVVKGGLDTIERCRPVLLIEAGAWHFASRDTNPWHLLASRGYRFWETGTLAETDLEGVRRRLPERDDEMGFSVNLIAAAEPLILRGAADGVRQ